MTAVIAQDRPFAWWRAALARFDLAAAGDYSSTEYLLDHIAKLEADMRSLRAELDAMKVRPGPA